MNYSLLHEQCKALIANETNMIANLANISALLFQQLDEVNWAGFYLVDNVQNELVLGPFQGLPACVRIPFDKGVCGAAARTLCTQYVDDVHAFPGHIACDVASNSEVVVPIVKDGQLVGVLDIDSPKLARFSEQDVAGLEGIVTLIEASL